jgi:hypothetical protein
MSVPRRLLTISLTAALIAALTGGTASAAPGATLFADDFTDGDTAGWRTSGGRWAVSTEDGSALRQSSSATTARARAGESSWKDYAVSARVRTLAGDTRSATSVLARVQSDGSHYYLATRADATVELGKVVRGRTTVLASAPYTAAGAYWRGLSLVVKGSTLVGVISGTPVLRATDTQLRTGRIGLATTRATALFDDVTVVSYAPTSPDTQPPLTPAPPKIVAVTPSTATISWEATVDNVGVTEYVVYQGNSFFNQFPVGTFTGPGQITLPLSPTAAAIYFAVVARDAAGNATTPFNRVSIPQPPSFPKTGTDTVPPTPAGNPTRSGFTADGKAILTWAPATDDVGVVEYHVYLVVNLDDYRLLGKVSEPTATVAVPAGGTHCCGSSPTTRRGIRRRHRSCRTTRERRRPPARPPPARPPRRPPAEATTGSWSGFALRGAERDQDLWVGVAARPGGSAATSGPTGSMPGAARQAMASMATVPRTTISTTAMSSPRSVLSPVVVRGLRGSELMVVSFRGDGPCPSR